VKTATRAATEIVSLFDWPPLSISIRIPLYAAPTPDAAAPRIDEQRAFKAEFAPGFWAAGIDFDPSASACACSNGV